MLIQLSAKLKEPFKILDNPLCEERLKYCPRHIE